MIRIRDELSERILVSDDERVTIGRYSYGRPKVFMWQSGESLDIGSFTSFADKVTIFIGGEHNINWVSTYPLRYLFSDPQAGLDGHPTSRGPVRIGSDVWVGFGSTILSGVSIGDGAVIGARAVVSKDVPPYAVVSGNPASVIKYRFDKSQIRDLLNIKWWNWDLELIKESTPYLCSSDINKFIELSNSLYQSGVVTR